jgi:hypothetical protein
MYASDVTQRKRAQVIYSDISKQKALFDTGKIFRLNYQKGGSDYSYMMELEQGCVMNTCMGDITLYPISGNGIANMDPVAGGYTQINITNSPTVTIRENGYAYNASTFPYTQAIGTLDDSVIPLPMGDMSGNFNMFGVGQGKLAWTSNNAIVFDYYDSGAGVIDSTLGVWTPDIYSTAAWPTAAHGGFPAILLGNYDRRLNSIYSKAYSTLKYKVVSMLVFFQDGYGGTGQTGNANSANTGQFQINIVKEVGGEKRQWIELRVAKMTASTGYIAGNTNTNSGTPVGGLDPTITDSTKLSPFNICNGSKFLNPCKTTYSTTGPAANTSMLFQSDSTGTDWNFFNNMHLELS